MYRSKFRKAARTGMARGRATRRTTGSTSVRRGTNTNYVRNNTRRSATARAPIRFAITGYAKDVERKYSDKVIACDRTPCSINATMPSAGGAASAENASQGNWYRVTLPGTITPPYGMGPQHQQDLLKGLPQGTTAEARIGNKINVKYIKGNISLSANTKVLSSTSATEQANKPGGGGEAVTAVYNAASTFRYLRTTYRVAIVRDLQVNSTWTNVQWGDVFSLVDGTAGVHSELSVNNMGRFRILMDKIIELDSDDPQKTIPFMVRNVGPVRYNGPDVPNLSMALTDNGIYIVWACRTQGVQASGNGNEIWSEPVVINSRICFTDN